MTLNSTSSFFTSWPSLTRIGSRYPLCNARTLMLRCEWIWQTYCWVTKTSFTLGRVTTILWCSNSASSLCLLQAGREREISATMIARICEVFIEFFARWFPLGSCTGSLAHEAIGGGGVCRRPDGGLCFGPCPPPLDRRMEGGLPDRGSE